MGNSLAVTTPAEHGVPVANLPYGERMGKPDELAAPYPKLGDAGQSEEEV